jgi:hypothetical protein
MAAGCGQPARLWTACRWALVVSAGQWALVSGRWSAGVGQWVWSAGVGQRIAGLALVCVAGPPSGRRQGADVRLANAQACVDRPPAPVGEPQACVGDPPTSAGEPRGLVSAVAPSDRPNVRQRAGIVARAFCSSASVSSRSTMSPAR